MGQRGAILVVTGKIQTVGVNLFRIARFLARQLAHQRIRLAALPGAVEIA